MNRSEVFDGIEGRRLVALDLATDPHTTPNWSGAYIDYAQACERLIGLREKSAIRPAEGD